MKFLVKRIIIVEETYETGGESNETVRSVMEHNDSIFETTGCFPILLIDEERLFTKVTSVEEIKYAMPPEQKELP